MLSHRLIVQEMHFLIDWEFNQLSYSIQTFNCYTSIQNMLYLKEAFGLKDILIKIYF